MKNPENDLNKNEQDNDPEVSLPGYPPYPPEEDIYNQFIKEEDLDPDDLSKKKAPNEMPGKRNEKDFHEDVSGRDLDVPGSELDDVQEDIGSEDEENNSYSMTDDVDLEEDPGK